MSEYIYSSRGEVLANQHGEISLPRREIVRCRDCKWFTPECEYREEREYGAYEDVWEPGGCFNPERRPYACGESGGWHVVGIDTPPDGFCAWACRRGDA